MSEQPEKKKRGRGGGKHGRTWKTTKVKKLEAQIVQTILGNPSVRTAKAIAEIIGRPVSTVARAMKDPEVKARLKEILYDFVDKELIHKAVANITRSIVQDENVADSKWLMEHVDFFPKEDSDEQDKWAVFQETLANGIVGIIKNAKNQNGENIEIDGLDPDTFVYYQPQPPVSEN